MLCDRYIFILAFLLCLLAISINKNNSIIVFIPLANAQKNQILYCIVYLSLIPKTFFRTGMKKKRTPLFIEKLIDIALTQGGLQLSYETNAKRIDV